MKKILGTAILAVLAVSCVSAEKNNFMQDMEKNKILSNYVFEADKLAENYRENTIADKNLNEFDSKVFKSEADVIANITREMNGKIFESTPDGASINTVAKREAEKARKEAVEKEYNETVTENLDIAVELFDLISPLSTENQEKIKEAIKKANAPVNSDEVKKNVAELTKKWENKRVENYNKMIEANKESLKINFEAGVKPLTYEQHKNAMATEAEKNDVFKYLPKTDKK